MASKSAGMYVAQLDTFARLASVVASNRESQPSNVVDSFTGVMYKFSPTGIGLLEDQRQTNDPVRYQTLASKASSAHQAVFGNSSSLMEMKVEAAKGKITERLLGGCVPKKLNWKGRYLSRPARYFAELSRKTALWEQMVDVRYEGEYVHNDVQDKMGELCDALAVLTEELLRSSSAEQMLDLIEGIGPVDVTYEVGGIENIWQAALRLTDADKTADLRYSLASAGVVSDLPDKITVGLDPENLVKVQKVVSNASKMFRLLFGTFEKDMISVGVDDLDYSARMKAFDISCMESIESLESEYRAAEARLRETHGTRERAVQRFEEIDRQRQGHTVSHSHRSNRGPRYPSFAAMGEAWSLQQGAGSAARDVELIDGELRDASRKARRHAAKLEEVQVMYVELREVESAYKSRKVDADGRKLRIELGREAILHLIVIGIAGLSVGVSAYDGDLSLLSAKDAFDVFGPVAQVASIGIKWKYSLHEDANVVKNWKSKAAWLDTFGQFCSGLSAGVSLISEIMAVRGGDEVNKLNVVVSSGQMSVAIFSGINKFAQTNTGDALLRWRAGKIRAPAPRLISVNPSLLKAMGEAGAALARTGIKRTLGMIALAGGPLNAVGYALLVAELLLPVWRNIVSWARGGGGLTAVVESQMCLLRMKWYGVDVAGELGIKGDLDEIFKMLPSQAELAGNSVLRAVLDAPVASVFGLRYLVPETVVSDTFLGTRPQTVSFFGLVPTFGLPSDIAEHGVETIAQFSDRMRANCDCGIFDRDAAVRLLESIGLSEAQARSVIQEGEAMVEPEKGGDTVGSLERADYDEDLDGEDQWPEWVYMQSDGRDCSDDVPSEDGGDDSEFTADPLGQSHDGYLDPFGESH